MGVQEYLNTNNDENLLDYVTNTENNCWINK